MGNWNQNLLLVPSILCLLPTPALAQITPDGTLPNNSLVTPNGSIIRIDGGTATGSHLFHSFEEFSVPANAEVFFNNAPEIQNIFSRITGTSVSNIDGTIAARGNANLFLLNPNGIIFGPEARLRIGGSFFATTAESVVFDGGNEFSSANPQGEPLLTVNAPIGLQFGTAPGAIRVQGPGHNLMPDPSTGAVIRRDPSQSLQVLPGKTLAIVGGDVSLEGGNLIAPEGQIELGSVGSNALVGLPPSLSLNYQGVSNFGNIELSQISSVDTSSTNDANSQGAGDIRVQGGRVAIAEGSVILAVTRDNPGGTVTVSATDVLELSGTSAGEMFVPSGLLTETLGAGDAGNLSVAARRFIVRDGAQASVSTSGSGRGGNLSVRASESIELSGIANIDFVSGLFALTEGAGVGGNITISTDRLTISNGAAIEALAVGEFGDRPAGNVTINASELVELTGPTPPEALPSLISTQTLGNGNGGNIIITAPQLIVRDGTQILTVTFGSGNAGDLVIRASEFVEVSGRNEEGVSGLSAEVFNSQLPPELQGGNGGDLRVETRELRVLDGAQIVAGTNGTGRGGNVEIEVDKLTIESGAAISAATRGVGQGGTLTVNARESIELSGTETNDSVPSGLFTQSILPPPEARTGNSLGNAGDLTVSTKRLIVRDGAAISADTFLNGQGGNLTINASESVEIIGQSANSFPSESSPFLDSDGLLPSRITASSTETGDAGTVSINTDRLVVRDGALAAVDSSLGTGAAGNLNINAPDIRLDRLGTLSANTAAGQGNINIDSEDIRLRNGSQITTNAQTATGGNIDLDTETLTALENSDITANALEGRGGRVTVDARSILGTEFRDASNLETSDITASSNLGPEFSGIVQLNTPDIDPTQSLIEFDDQIEDISGLIDENICEEGEEGLRSQFIITGRGGLPANPGRTLSPRTIWRPDPPQPPLSRGEQEGPASEDRGAGGDSPLSPPLSRGAGGDLQEPIVEALGLILNAEGKIELTTEPQTLTPRVPWYVPPGCRRLSRDGEEPAFLVSSRSSLPLFAANSNPPQTVTVEKFQIVGSEALGEEELNEVLKPFIGKEMTFAELVAARTAITKLYTEKKYITSGAYIPPQVIENNTVEIRVVEGVIRDRDIQVSTNGNLNENYLKSRLELAAGGTLNEDRLLEGLQLLRLNPLIDRVKAELSEGIDPGTSVLEVRVEEVDPWDFEIISDNGRTPGVGTFQRGAEISNSNFLGRGDRLSLAYNNTDGSNNVATSYTLPINARNGTIQLSYENQSSEIIEPPFDPLDIEADSETYQLTFRQPIVLKPRTEFALGLTASRRESQTSILGENFPLSRGANNRGETKLSTLSFFQDWVRREDNQVFAARSEFNFGVDAFDATVNNNGPDGRFFSWQGQAQWVRRLDKNNNTLLLMRGNVQLSPDELVGLEQFGLGGLQSVRGYRQDARLTDNGVLGSVELRLPISWVSNDNRRISLVPFVDGGVGWNNGNNDAPTPNALASVGLGLQAELGDNLTMRFDYAFPLVEIDSRDRTWQENGLYFSLELNPF
ncbi:MAG: ShlB/FhaC/HecB family hemolysin secretion/activation protein [Cyanobacteriota bacterium]|nr:ShlB/FhaC/HecB family hemolysin secretion/activation protein [Cyanobacteriota bacterium]